MMTSMRTIVDLPTGQLDGLDRLCHREGISRAEGVRRAVALLVAQDSAAGARSAFGLWRDRVKDGLQYQRALRKEWGNRWS